MPSWALVPRHRTAMPAIPLGHRLAIALVKKKRPSLRSTTSFTKKSTSKQRRHCRLAGAGPTCSKWRRRPPAAVSPSSSQSYRSVGYIKSQRLE